MDESVSDSVAESIGDTILIMVGEIAPHLPSREIDNVLENGLLGEAVKITIETTKATIKFSKGSVSVTPKKV